MELRTYQFRLYPSGKQQVNLLNQFDVCKEVYNILLSENKKYFFTSRPDFNLLIRDIKAISPEYYSQVYAQALQNVGDRLHKALNNFFGRIKLREQGVNVKAGFPRFKSKIKSITYPQARHGFKFLSNKRLHVSKIGNIPIILHRLPKGKIKRLTIKQNSVGQWHALFCCEVDMPIIKHPHPDSKIGIDVGLEKFLTDNKGQSTANPRFYLNVEKKLAREQRRLSRKVLGSKNRNKQRIKVARVHLKVFNQRSDFLHKLSHSLTKEYKIICGEKLNIQNMLKGNLAKHILDASWYRFYQMLSYKAVTCGGELRKNPKTRGSSKRCSTCGTEVDMPLRKRTFTCANCGLVSHRDINSAINHVNDTDGLSEISTPVETQPLPSLSVKASRVREAGTTYGT